MDVNELEPVEAPERAMIGGARRRALARLGISSPGPYVAPTLLALRSTAHSSSPQAGIAA